MLTQSKPKIAYSDELKQVFSLISFSGNYNVAGTADLKSILYPSDYDLNQKIIENQPLEIAKKKILKIFREKFKKIKENQDIFFMDFKAGIDHETFFDDYSNSFSYQQYVDHLYRNQYIDKDVYSDMITKKTIEDRRDASRKLFILRWTPDEIIQGYKILSLQRKKKLIDCLLDPTIIKLDVIAKVGYGNFIELSDIYQFRIHHRDALKSSRDEILKAIKEDMNHYREIGNDYKALKRLFSIAKLKKQTKKIEILIHLFNSNIGLINKVKGNLEVYHDLVSKIHDIDIEEIFFAIQQDKQFLSNVYEFSMSDELYFKFDELTSLPKKDKDKILLKIDELMDDLKNIIQKQTVQWIKKHKTIFS